MVFIKCNYSHADCAFCIGGYCKILSARINKDECPFYKTDNQLDEGKAQAHKRLVETGRRDLISKYEYNNNRDW